MNNKSRNIFSRQDWWIIFVIAGLFIWFVITRDVPVLNKITGLFIGLVVFPGLLWLKYYCLMKMTLDIYKKAGPLPECLRKDS